MNFKSLFSLLILFSFAAYSDHEKNEPSDGTVKSFIEVSPPRYLEPVNFYDLNGKAVNFSAFKDKVLLVNLWATWCGPCLRELPALQRLSNKLNGTDFKLIAISIDRDKSTEEVFDFYKQLSITDLSFYIDGDQQISKILPTDVVPANFMINRRGEVVSYMRSFADWDAPEATEMILQHLSAVPYRRPTLNLPTH